MAGPAGAWQAGGMPADLRDRLARPACTCAPTPVNARATCRRSWTRCSPVAWTSSSSARRVWRPRRTRVLEVFAPPAGPGALSRSTTGPTSRTSRARTSCTSARTTCRRTWPADRRDDTLIGRSTHAEAEVDRASAEPGADYFCTGPCWPTPTKPGRPAPGLRWSSTQPRPGPRAVVRDRRHRRGQPRRGARGRGPPDRRRARADRGRGPRGGGRPRPVRPAARGGPRWLG